MAVEQILERMVMGQKYNAWKCEKVTQYKGRSQELADVS